MLCADEKSQLQALGRRHASLPPAPGRAARFEFDYRPRRHPRLPGARWDVHHANLFDRVEAKTGREPFDRLVDEVMSLEPYASADRLLGRRQRLIARRSGIDRRLEGAYDNRA